jgi:putative endopeptidase
MRATVAFFAALILWIVTSAQPSATQPKPDFLVANIDPTVSPREDFFQYANGEWLKRNPIPEDQARWGIWSVVWEDIYSRLRRISEEAAAKKAPRGSSEQLIGDFWATGMDSAKVNKQGLAPLQPDLDRIDRIRSIEDLIDFVAVLHKRSMLTDSWIQPRVLFYGRVEQDERNSERRILSLTQGGTSMGLPAFSATDPQRVKIRAAFRDYLFKTFLRLHRDSRKAKVSAEAVYELEAQLAKAFYQGDGYQEINLTELHQLTPSIDWNHYFRRIGITKIDSVNMRKPRFYQALDSLIRTISLEHWKDYLRFSLIYANATFLDDETFGEFFAYNSTYTGQLQPPPRWKRVVWQEKNWLGQPLARLFVKEYFAANVKARYQAIAESIRQAFRERIVKLDWMGDSTKQNALLKLSRLKITIGFPEKWMDFSTMQLRRDSYALNMMRSAEWFHDWEIKHLNMPVDRTEVNLHATVGGDAEYDVQNNEVRVPGSVVVPGMRDQELDDAFIYGASYLGHEISHAFDSEGRHYDAYGNKLDWWTVQDSAAFDARVQVMIEEYNEFTPLEGLHVDGQRSLAENMADLVGLRVALDAFKKTEQFKKNERVGGFTPLQRFFLAYAYGHMGHERRESLAARLRDGTYAPDRERVNGVMMNIPEFYEAFDVKPGDRMYGPENKRVKIW